MNYFYYCVETIFECGYRNENDEMFTVSFSAFHTVSDKCYKEDNYKKTIYLYGVERAFEIGNDKNYDVSYVRIFSQKTWMESEVI